MQTQQQFVLYIHTYIISVVDILYFKSLVQHNRLVTKHCIPRTYSLFLDRHKISTGTPIVFTRVRIFISIFTFFVSLHIEETHIHIIIRRNNSNLKIFNGRKYIFYSLIAPMITHIVMSVFGYVRSNLILFQNHSRTVIFN